MINRNIVDVIRMRRSVRTYNGEELNEQQIEALHKAILESENPLGPSPTIRICRFDAEKGFRPSTYGVIRGASSFFTVAYSDGEAAELAAGYQFEQVVLEAAAMGLGTCWIAATFRKSDFATTEPWPDGQKLKVVSPVGVPAGKSLMERMTRFTFGCDKRKPFDKLFFNGNFNTPLSADSTFALPLEMMRLAPSSTNSQPWRALVDTDGATVHFFYKPVSGLSVLDCGIGLYHFQATERQEGHVGKLQKLDVVPPHPSKYRYLISYIRN